jgi:lysophospholipase L1-like esterase
MGMLRQSIASQAVCVSNIPSVIYWTSSGIDRRIYFPQAAISLNCAREIVQIECNLIIGGTIVGQHDVFGLLVPSATTLTAGTHTNALRIQISVDGVLKFDKYTTVVVVANTAGGGATRKLLAIGDSNTASDTWVIQTTTRDTADANFTLTKIGTKGSAPNQHEGISGKTFSYFYSDAASPFVFSGSFDFAQYLTANGLTMSAGDWVNFMLGTNDVGTKSSEALLDAAITAMLVDLEAMIVNIRAAVPGIRVLISPPIPCSDDQEDFNLNYGTGLSRDFARRNLHKARTALVNAYDSSAKRALGIYVSTSGSILDVDSDFSGNAIHPIAAGLNRLGDAIWMQTKALA